MMRFNFLFLALLLIHTGMVRAQKVPDYHVRIKTDYGSCVVRLYNETPVHRDNFIRLVKRRYFDSTLFHRIIANFVAQGGDADTLYIDKDKLNKHQKWIGQEFRDSLYHKRGVLAMGRDDNAEKASFSTQFYLVQGRKWTDAQLDEVQRKHMNGRLIPDYQRDVYKRIGGLPFLDQDYTVFGEVVEGMELLDTLSALKMNKEDAPLKNVRMQIRMIKR